MIQVLFVCLGNICRSPMAEAVFLRLVRDAGLSDQIQADSAGTGDWHVGHAPHPGTRHVLEVNGIGDYEHVARQLMPLDLTTFDYVLTMDAANLRAVRALPPGRAVVCPFLSYAGTDGDVPDPYYTGDFDETYALVSEAAAGLLASLRQEHGL